MAVYNSGKTGASKYSRSGMSEMGTRRRTGGTTETTRGRGGGRVAASGTVTPSQPLPRWEDLWDKGPGGTLAYKGPGSKVKGSGKLPYGMTVESYLQQVWDASGGDNPRPWEGGGGGRGGGNVQFQTEKWTPSGPAPTMSRPKMGGPGKFIMPDLGPPTEFGPMPEYEKPEFGDLPDYISPEYIAPESMEKLTFQAPEWNTRELESITQRKAAGSTRSLREATQSAISGAGAADSPAMQRMSLRQALAGYGMGLEQIMSGASTQARQEYLAEKGLEMEGKTQQFGAERERVGAEYGARVQQATDTFRSKLQEAETTFGAKFGKQSAQYQANVDRARERYRGELETQLRQQEYAERARMTVFEAAMDKSRLTFQAHEQARLMDYQLNFQANMNEFENQYDAYLKGGETTSFGISGSGGGYGRISDDILGSKMEYGVGGDRFTPASQRRYG